MGTTPNQGNAAGLSYVEGFFESSHSPYTATLVPVTEKEGPSDIDITLERGGDISGRVRDTNGKSKEGIMITATSYEYWIFEPSSGEAWTDPNGRYTITLFTEQLSGLCKY